jgi:outer membrane protein TolC
MSLVLSLALSSCQSIDWSGLRKGHADELTKELSAKTTSALSPEHPLTVMECVQIAQANNLDIRVAEIQSKLARLDRKAAFSAFLPVVDLQVQGTAMDKPPAVQFMGMSIQMTDQEVVKLAIQAQMPIFSPQAWLAHSARKKAEDLQRLVTERTRQLITLQVAAYFLGVKAQEAQAASLTQGVAEAELVLKEAEAFQREGLATASHVEEAKTLLIFRQTALTEARRSIRGMQSNLLQVMGLSPLASLSLTDPPHIELPEASLDDRALTALLQRPELGIADRVTEIRKDEVKIAIANFLPNVLGVGGLNYSSDSYLLYSTVWSAGISGVMTVFDGFANIWEYQAAKEKKKEAFVAREKTCMAVLLEVLQAQLNEESARDSLAVAEQALRAAETKVTEVKAQWEQGLIQGSDYLRVLSDRDTAGAQRSLANFRHQVTVVTLMDVMGEGKY